MALVKGVIVSCFILCDRLNIHEERIKCSYAVLLPLYEYLDPVRVEIRICSEYPQADAVDFSDKAMQQLCPSLKYSYDHLFSFGLEYVGQVLPYLFSLKERLKYK